MHNVGSPSKKIPARKFTAPAFDKNINKTNNLLDKTINSVVANFCLEVAKNSDEISDIEKQECEKKANDMCDTFFSYF